MNKPISQADLMIGRLKRLATDKNADGGALAQAISDAYDHNLKSSFVDLFQRIAQDQRAHDKALYKAGLAIAAALDSDTKAKHNTNPYHNTDHLKMVMINAFVLAQIAKRDGFKEPTLDLLVAAMIHDAAHDGKTNYDEKREHTPFRLENMAMDYARDVLEKNAIDIDSQNIECIRAMLHWTDLSSRSSQFKETHKGISSSDMEKCLMLGDADLMSSMAISGKMAFQSESNIHAEWKRALVADGFKKFVDYVAPNGFLSKAGRVFNGNIAPIVAYMNRAIVNKTYSARRALFPTP